ncbi:AAA family ATPase [Pseudomonas putida]|uniref:AAA family ATPase n=1 Tax=Pseudomonas putida TaxID=303 RepID=A0A7Y8D3D0_PSEPU|nr:AAA family ATPase [Pseudomonas putida]NWC83165.1 AAA family ATPase [Pseudomonas putida]
MNKTVLYLPLLQSQADALKDMNAPVADLLSQWGIPQVASVVVIQNLPALRGQPKIESKIENGLADMIAVATDLEKRSTPGQFATVVAGKFKLGSFEQGLALLQNLGVRFLGEEALEAQDFLTEEGVWDRTFFERYSSSIEQVKYEIQTDSSTFMLTNQQARVFRVLQAEPDESIHVEGRAGTGKTHLITRLVESLGSCKPLLLAFTAVQLAALMERLGAVNSSLKGMTFGDLAKHMLETDPKYRRPGKRGFARHQVSPREVAARLGFQPIGKFNPGQVASICAQAVASFCQSTDQEVIARHIPKRIFLGAVDQGVLLHYANELWRQTIEPTDPHYDLPVRIYHRIKHMTMAREPFIDGGFTHIIVDEAHDLPRPLANFLDRCSQPIITLGDVCQKLDGYYFDRAGSIRKQEINCSVRAGRQIENVINPLIEKHPVLHVGAIEGNASFDTKVTYYDKPEIPTGKVTILVDSEWGLFEWFQRLGHAGESFSLLPGAVSSFKLFITECIALYHIGTRPTHSALYRFPSWGALQAEMVNNASFQRIERMLGQSYQLEDFEKSLERLDVSGDASLKLGRVMDARNSEIDCVMLAPDLLGDIHSGDRVGASMAFAALYTGGTRARYSLIVPGYLRDWATDVSRIVTLS